MQKNHGYFRRLELPQRAIALLFDGSGLRLHSKVLIRQQEVPANDPKSARVEVLFHVPQFE
jgi:hypothetical protein